MALDSSVVRAREYPETEAGPELTLIEALEAQAQAECLSGRKLMRGVGLDQSLWSKVRRGHERFGLEACARIVARYPTLRGAATRYLAERYGHPALSLLEDANQLVRPRRVASRRIACR